MSKSLAKAQQKRDAIVQAAESLFLAQGYGVTRMDRIAEAAAVTKQTVYRYFPTKEELFVAVMERVRSAQAPPYAFASGTLAEELSHFGRDVLGFHLQETALGLYRLMLTEGTQGGLMPSFMQTGPQRLLQPLVKFLQERAPHLDDHAFAAQMFLTMLLAPRNQRLMNDTLKLGKAVQTNHVHKVMTFFLKAIER